MAVAKSYENMEQLGQPFMQEGRMYVKVVGKCKRCGGSGHYSYNSLDGTVCFGCRGSGKELLTVRWYTEKEKAAQERAAERRQMEREIKQNARRIKFAARNAFGFGEPGYITIYKGDQERIAEFFKSYTIDDQGHRGAWFNLIFGWYTPSKLPEAPLPEDIQAVRLNWADVADPEDEENLQMRDNDWVTEYVQSLICEPSKSEFQGEKDEWLERKVTVVKKVNLDGRYGPSHMHIMEDSDKNVYIWTTGSKDLNVDANYTIRMKVKDHKVYKNVKQTIVWYCKVKEEE